jgi:hypothetical protein
MSKMVRTLVFLGAPLVWKLLKSWVPTRAAAARRIAAASSRP